MHVRISFMANYIDYDLKNVNFSEPLQLNGLMPEKSNSLKSTDVTYGKDELPILSVAIGSVK
jgi:hypothetical protein